MTHLLIPAFTAATQLFEKQQEAGALEVTCGNILEKYIIYDFIYILHLYIILFNQV